MPPRNYFPLPEDLAPSVFRCVQFNLPDDPQWEYLFWGSIDQLQLWNSYERSSGGEGKTVADVWKGIIDSAQESSCGCPCFNWTLINLAQGDCDQTVNSNGIHAEIDEDCNPDLPPIIHGAQINAAADGKYHWGMTGQREDGLFVGGRLSIVRVDTLSFLNPSSITLTWLDCDGAHHTDAVTTGELKNVGVVCQWFCVESNNPFHFYARVLGDYICLIG